jgi:hypothetical protein
LDRATSNADETVASKDYIDNGIAALEDFLAVKASEESLVLA